MNAVDSLPTVAERLPADTSIGIYARAEERRLPIFWWQELLLEPNCYDANQTQPRHINGASSPVGVDSKQFSIPARYSPEIREYFRALQKWEGHVIEVSMDTFRARVVPTLGEGSDQEAEIYIEEVQRDDRELIVPGAVFYWSIGYLDRPQGRLLASVLVFRRLPVWTRRELENAKAEAARLKGLLGVD